MTDDPPTQDEDADAPESAVRQDRFSGGPAREFMSSLSADRRIVDADLAVDRAHVVMLAECGIVDGSVAGEILAALDDVEAAIEADGYDAALPAGEDVHEAIETAVIERIGSDGGRMHTARSRNDEVATCIRYRLRDDLLDALETVVGAREAVLSVAEAESGTLLPGYTHLQPAQPVTVGFWAASYEAALARDVGRLLDAYGRVNRSPLGAAAFAGTTFDVDRERTADLLGFSGDATGEAAEPALVENATDAVSGRDVLLEVTGALSALSVTLSGLAEDLVIYANRDFVDLDDDYASTSSIMPQKKNPDSLELVRAVAGDAAGAHSGLATTLKGLPRSYNRDLQRAAPHVWDIVDDVVEAVDVAAGAVATAEWNEDVLESAAAEGFSTATGVADLLARSGLPFRTAHHVVADAARALEAGEVDADAADAGALATDAADARDIGTDAGEAGGDTTDTAAQVAALEAAAEAELDEPLSAYVDDAALEAALDPSESVASRNSRGGPAPAAVGASIERARERLDDHREAVDARRATVEAAGNRLRSEVERYV